MYIYAHCSISFFVDQRLCNAQENITNISNSKVQGDPESSQEGVIVLQQVKLLELLTRM